jgi:hypothetical protein
MKPDMSRLVGTVSLWFQWKALKRIALAQALKGRDFASHRDPRMHISDYP